MLAAAIEKGIITLEEMTLEEWQWALAYFEGIEKRHELKRYEQTSKPGEISGSLYSPEEMLDRLR